MPRVPKNIGSELDYGLDWTDWLEDIAHQTGIDDIISTAVWDVPPEFSVDRQGILDGKITYIWISDGAGITAGKYTLTCAITTEAGRKESEVLIVTVK